MAGELINISGAKDYSGNIQLQKWIRLSGTTDSLVGARQFKRFLGVNWPI